MLTVRPAQWPQDIGPISALDSEFETDHIYRLVRDGFSFQLKEEVVVQPIKKRYDFDPSDDSERATWHYAVVAEEDGVVAGFAAATHETWNNRVNIRHLYVGREHRRKGAGTLLVNAIVAYTRFVGARSLWLETQNINYPAIQFYLKSGFWFCGFDAGLYDPKTVQDREIALFFERQLTASR